MKSFIILRSGEIRDTLLISFCANWFKYFSPKSMPISIESCYFKVLYLCIFLDCLKTFHSNVCIFTMFFLSEITDYFINPLYSGGIFPYILIQ